MRIRIEQFKFPIVAVCWLSTTTYLDGRAYGQTTSQPAPPPSGPQTAESIEQEVHENILNQSIGSQTVRDLNLPDAFVRRATDRIIRTAYEQRYRIVVQDSPGATGNAATPANSAKPNIPGTAAGSNWSAVIAGGAAVIVAIIAFAGFRKKESP